MIVYYIVVSILGADYISAQPYPTFHVCFQAAKLVPHELNPDCLPFDLSKPANDPRSSSESDNANPNGGTIGP